MGTRGDGAETGLVREWKVDWDGFKMEYPELANEGRERWVERLVEGLKIIA